jgi:hypothetical protein
MILKRMTAAAAAVLQQGGCTMSSRNNCRHTPHQRGNSVLRLLRRPPYSCPLSGSPMTESMLCRLSVLPDDPSFRCSMDGDTCTGHGMLALGGWPADRRLITPGGPQRSSPIAGYSRRRAAQIRNAHLQALGCQHMFVFCLGCGFDPACKGAGVA